MAVTLREHVYQLTGTGKKVQCGYVTETEEDMYYVGGKIFFIDESSDEVVEFFDQFGDPIENVAVGDTPYCYRIVRRGESGKDKYYVYHDQLFSSKRWTYYENGEYVYNLLNTENGIGKGRSNTNKVMTADDGKYITNNSNGYATIWYTLKQMRDNLYGGCDDWFVPSRAELEELRKAIGFIKQADADPAPEMEAGPVTGGTIAGTADGATHKKSYNGYTTYYPSATKFLDSYIWSSSEYSARSAWLWYYYGQDWDSNYKRGDDSFLAVRAF